jgi:4-hydroxybenzoate polyprenyltransferase
VIIVAAVILTLIMGIAIFYLSWTIDSFSFIFMSVAVGVYLLLLPALKLYQSYKQSHAMALFNKASYYPAALLVIVLIKMMV